MKYTVVGGAGAMGRITVTDLVKTSSSSDEVVIADFDLKKAQALADTFQSISASGKAPRVSAVFCDIKDQSQSFKALNGAGVVINSAHYQLNLNVMEAALAVRAHYTDLGGLFHVTRKQMELDSKFKAIGRSAVIGMGAAPGITNLLARLACDKLDTVREIHCRVGGMDKTRYSFTPGLAVSYSIKTILEEFSFEPAVFTKGDFKFVKPMSGDVPHLFPKPVGVRKPMYTIHSEVATLPLSFKDKGVQEVSFKIAFDPVFVDRVKFLRDVGLASHEVVEVDGARVKPIDLVNRVIMAQPQPSQIGKLKQYEVVRSIVKGTFNKKKVTWVVDCHTAGMPEWGMGIDIDTGSPPAVVAQMIAAGEITATGVVAPEVSVPPERFFERLKKRKMKVKALKKSGWSFKT